MYDRGILCENYWRYCCSIVSYNYEDADADPVYYSFDKDKDTSCIPKFIKRKDLETKLQPLDSFEIKIDIKKYADSPRPKPECFELSKDFSTALSDMMFSDFTIVCGEEKFDCHAFVLAARSPVFKGMLTSNFKERINMELKIDSVTPEILKV